ncbi:MAG: DUF2927 domain-containing protein [Pseudomonadota bacterium]
MKSDARQTIRALACVAALGVMTTFGACTMFERVGAKPQARPANLDTSAARADPSPESEALTRYYTRVQSHLLAQDLLRTDGGGVDTPYDTADVARNFERIAFYNEYVRGANRRAVNEGPDILRRWDRPVQMAVEYGDTVTQEVRDTDTRLVRDYAARLSRITGHAIGLSDRNPNFYVIISTEDDRDRVVERVKELAPWIGTATVGIIRNPPRSIYCLVVTFSSPDAPATYDKAIALIRAEQPGLMRQSCIHEELAQGLGLGNDSATARPSIFNDDEEFALLTSHDEELLRLLYHPTLKPGMSLDQARPIISRILNGDPGQI